MQRCNLEQDSLSELELEHVLPYSGAPQRRREGQSPHLWGTAISPAVAEYFAVLLWGWLSITALEIGCGGGIAPGASAAQLDPSRYAGNEGTDAPVSAFLVGTDLHFSYRRQLSAGTSFAPLRFPAVPVSAFLLPGLQQLSVTSIQMPAMPLPAQQTSNGAAPDAPTLSVQ